MYTRSPTGKNDVAEVLSEELRKDPLGVDCRRLMRVRVLIDGELLLARAYAAQAGCSAAEKEYLWENLKELLHAIPNLRDICCGDLKGHVSQLKRTRVFMVTLAMVVAI